MKIRRLDRPFVKDHAMFKFVADFFARQARKHTLSAELNAMNDRELADIGISRGDIEFIVLQSLADEAAAKTAAPAAARAPNLATIYNNGRLA